MKKILADTIRPGSTTQIHHQLNRPFFCLGGRRLKQRELALQVGVPESTVATVSDEDRPEHAVHSFRDAQLLHVELIDATPGAVYDVVRYTPVVGIRFRFDGVAHTPLY